MLAKEMSIIDHWKQTNSKGHIKKLETTTEDHQLSWSMINMCVCVCVYVCGCVCVHGCFFYFTRYKHVIKQKI